MKRYLRVGRAVATLSLATLAALVLVAAGDAAGTRSATGSSTAATPLKLVLGVGSLSTNYGPYWVAEAKNLFAKNGLDVNVVSYNTSGTTANVVASGKVDLQLFTAPLGLELAEHGKPISVVYELSSFNAQSMSVIGNPSITSIAQLRKLSVCRIATTAVGTVPYAYAVRYLKAQHLKCQIINESTVAPLLAAVGSGYAQAGIVTYSNALKALAAKQVSLLLNPLKVPKALAKKLVPTEYPSFVVFGLRSAVKKHAEAVTRFVKALREANAILVKTSPKTLGVWTSKLKAFAGTPAPLLADAWTGTMSQIQTGPNAGYITPDAWKAALEGFKQWGLPQYKATDPALSYNQVVDMSFFNNAG